MVGMVDGGFCSCCVFLGVVGFLILLLFADALIGFFILRQLLDDILASVQQLFNQPTSQS